MAKVGESPVVLTSSLFLRVFGNCRIWSLFGCWVSLVIDLQHLPSSSFLKISEAFGNQPSSLFPKIEEKGLTLKELKKKKCLKSLTR